MESTGEHQCSRKGSQYRTSFLIVKPTLWAQPAST